MDFRKRLVTVTIEWTVRIFGKQFDPTTGERFRNEHVEAVSRELSDARIAQQYRDLLYFGDDADKARKTSELAKYLRSTE